MDSMDIRGNKISKSANNFNECLFIIGEFGIVSWSMSLWYIRENNKN